MKIYTVIKKTAHTNSTLAFFTSHDKALRYLLGIITATKENMCGYYKENKDDWCYDINVLSDTKHWNDFKYVIEKGHATLHIEQIEVQ